jgi:hypothetical protein
MAALVESEQHTFVAHNRDGVLDYGRWVVVSGFSPGDFVSPILALQRHGEITRHCIGRKNCLFVQVFLHHFN